MEPDFGDKKKKEEKASVEEIPEISHDYAVEVVLQFLQESGYQDTLKALETESGKQYDGLFFKKPGALMNNLFELQELKALMAMDNIEDDEEINVQGEETFATEKTQQLKTVHNANILCLRFCPDEKTPVVATGSTDKTLKLINYETNELAHHFIGLFSGGVITLDFNPVFPHLLLTGSMDGTHLLIDINTKTVVQSFKVHQKYVVRVKWSPKGDLFATASYDKSACLYGKEGEEFVVKKRFEFPQNVEAIDFTKDGTMLIVASREDHCLNFIDVVSLSKERRNLNKNNDSHVSFSVMDISVSPAGSHLLVSTDHDRTIVYSITPNSLKMVRNLYGAKNDLYSQPRCCWDLSGKYVYSTSQDNKIYIWDVVTQKIVHKLQGHSGLVRDIHHHPTRSKFVGTCSYDKTVCFWN